MWRNVTFRLVLLLLCLSLSPSLAKGEERVRSILCTTFPVYQITRNVTRNHPGVTVTLLLSSKLGCPHDYALTPQDMQKLAIADVLIINGLGMESFLDSQIHGANPKLTVIDSSHGITGTMMYSGEACGEHDKEDGTEADHDGSAHTGACDHDPQHAAVNPHLFVSPRLSAALAQTIADGLTKADPSGAALYAKNAGIYAAELNLLADELAARGATLRNPRIVQPHGVFDYLARDIGLEIVAVMQAHGAEPSAAEMIRLVKVIRKEKPGAIFTEPQFPQGAGQTLAAETQIPLAMLDPAATGPEEAPLDYIQTVMRHNMATLEATLGVE